MFNLILSSFFFFFSSIRRHTRCLSGWSSDVCSSDLHFDEICGGNALNAAIGIVRLGGRASVCGPMGDARETTSRYIFDKLAHEGIDTKHIVHMPGLVTPISAIMI